MNRDWTTQDSTIGKLSEEQRFAAVHTVAGRARNAADLVELLEVLGLYAADGRPEEPAPSAEAPVRRLESLDRIQEMANELAELRSGHRIRRGRPRVDAVTPR